MEEENAHSEWVEKYERAISSVVRDTLTILEGFYLESAQRNALRRLIRKSIYGITDKLKEDLEEEFSKVEENNA